MGYEALREVWTGLSPYSTGDALKGGWAGTNLSLYSTSSIGYLGALLEKTNQEKILRLDLLKTDFFNDEAYPSYLLFNPYQSTKSVVIDAGDGPTDIYDAISESFLVQNVSGPVSLDIPADQAISIVLAPAGGTITYDNNKMLINDVVVDYRQSQIPYNYPPRIQAFATERYTVEKNSTVTFYGKGIDQETKDLVYTFFLPNDTTSGLVKTKNWTAPDEEGTFAIKLVVEDEAQQTDTAIITVSVVSEINYAPVIVSLTADKKYTAPGGMIRLTAEVTDPNDDPITYMWSANDGQIIGSDDIGDWLAPGNEGIYTVQLMVSDGRGGTATASIQLLVIDPSLHTEGNIIAWYPFEGNASDISGHQLNGTVFGAKLTSDTLGNPSAAYFFDGINDHIRVANDAILNFNKGITVSLFATPQLIGDKERFLISHGSWQNRWKISITPERKVRWTLKTVSGQVRDMDSETILEENKDYHIAGSYDGRFMLLYINGRLESFTAFSGDINPSPVELEIGQASPDEQMYNFRGNMDDVRIYDFALLPDSIAAQSGHVITGISDPSPALSPEWKVYPNPTSNKINVELGIEERYSNTADCHLVITDIKGQEEWKGAFGESRIKTIDISRLNPGVHFIRLEKAGKIWIKEFITIQ